MSDLADDLYRRPGRDRRACRGPAGDGTHRDDADRGAPTRAEMRGLRIPDLRKWPSDHVRPGIVTEPKLRPHPLTALRCERAGDYAGERPGSTAVDRPFLSGTRSNRLSYNPIDLRKQKQQTFYRTGGTGCAVTGEASLRLAEGHFDAADQPRSQVVDYRADGRHGGEDRKSVV